ncbi:hypothetical protein THASP1DRAFT_25760, partial [Thamnocephalis sphaerospora]
MVPMDRRRVPSSAATYSPASGSQLAGYSAGSSTPHEAISFSVNTKRPSVSSKALQPPLLMRDSDRPREWDRRDVLSLDIDLRSDIFGASVAADGVAATLRKMSATCGGGGGRLSSSILRFMVSLSATVSANRSADEAPLVAGCRTMVAVASCDADASAGSGPARSSADSSDGGN